jgi:menaquinone-dependent protoporphyrinogen oxidase
MKPIAVFYATREGHTRRIVEAIVRGLAVRRVPAEAIDLSRNGQASSLGRYAGAIVASPVHAGKYAREVTTFVQRNRSALDAMRSAFVSVTLSQAGVQRTDATAQEHEKFVADVRKLNERFFRRTGWRPVRVENVAGALLYTRYNFFLRFVMKRIAKASGGSTDTRRDHVYTDWEALDRFCAAFADALPAQADPA